MLLYITKMYNSCERNERSSAVKSPKALFFFKKTLFYSELAKLHCLTSSIELFSLITYFENET